MAQTSPKSAKSLLNCQPVPQPTHDLLVPLLARADEVVVVDAEEGGRGTVLGGDPVAKLPARKQSCKISLAQTQSDILYMSGNDKNFTKTEITYGH